MSAFKFINRTTGTFTDLQDALTATTDNVFGTAGGIALGPCAPGGRLCLASQAPLITANTSGNTVVYYTPYNSDLIPIYNGTNFVWNGFSEISQATTDTTLSPAACGNNLNYDYFAFMNGSSVAIARGPDWTQGGGSDTARGTGAGSTAITLTKGIYTNANPILNLAGKTIIPANQGTYLGSVRTNGSAQIDFKFSAIGTTTGTLATLGLWNYYNRAMLWAISHNTTNGYTYNSTNWREENGNTGNAKIQFISGLNLDPYLGIINKEMQGAAAGGGRAYFGIGVDSVTGTSNNIASTDSGESVASCVSCGWSQGALTGFHYFSMLEKVETGGNACTFYQDVMSQVLFWY